MKTFGKVGCDPASVLSRLEIHMKMVKMTHSYRDGRVHWAQFFYQPLQFLGWHVVLGGWNGQEDLQLRQPFGREAQGTILSADDTTKDLFDLGPVAVSLQFFSQTNRIFDLSREGREDFF